MKRDKITGIGIELKEFIEESGMSIREFAKKSNLKERLIINFVKLKKEPYIHEMKQMVNVLKTPTNEDRLLKFIDGWFEKAGRIND